MNVGVRGFEPPTTRPPDVYANRTALHPDDRQTVPGLNRVANIRSWTNSTTENGDLPVAKR